MKLETFWIVTEAHPISTLADICFQTDARGFALQVKGGLEPDEIVGLFTDEGRALVAARLELNKVTK